MFGLGAMSIGYGGQGEVLTYQTTASFQFISVTGNNLLLGFGNSGSLGGGFDTSTLDVFANGILSFERTFTSLGTAQAFFTDNLLDLGFQPDGLGGDPVTYALGVR